jgi:hypothetical protein
MSSIAPNREENKSHSEPAETSNEVVSYCRDPNYYYPDGSVVILVENILFKVLYPASASGWFDQALNGNNTKFQASLMSNTTHSSDGSSSGGGLLQAWLTFSSDSNPIKLTRITSAQFRNFLSVVLGM